MIFQKINSILRTTRIDFTYHLLYSVIHTYHNVWPECILTLITSGMEPMVEIEK